MKSRIQFRHESDAADDRHIHFYNLITLFLEVEGIRALGELINIDLCPEDEFWHFAYPVDELVIHVNHAVNGVPVVLGQKTDKGCISAPLFQFTHFIRITSLRIPGKGSLKVVVQP